MPKQTTGDDRDLFDLELEGQVPFGTLKVQPDNQGLLTARQPAVMDPEDEVFVPEDLPPREAVVRAGGEHTFVLKPAQRMLSLRVANAAGERFLEVKVEVDGQSQRLLAQDGLVQLPLAQGTREAKVSVAERSFNLRIGRLAPITTTEGVQARLHNMGLFAGPADGSLDAETRQALRVFQVMCGLPPSGDADPATRRALLKQHDGLEPCAQALPPVPDAVSVPEPSEEVHCVRLTGMFFETNKNFLLPSAVPGICAMVKVYREHRDGELLIVGHTDTSGDPTYNDPLSLERAQAVADYLADDVEAWLARYGSDVPRKKRWGTPEDMLMIRALDGAPDKQPDKTTVEWFQETRKDSYDLGKKPVDGIVGGKTRSAVITEYMALDGTTLPEGISATVHGCGESFPLGEDEGDAEAAARNRRVEFFVFDRGITPPPDGEISDPDSATYDSWKTSITKQHNFDPDLWVEIVMKGGEQPWANLRYVLHLPDGPPRQGVLDQDGYAREDGLPRGQYHVSFPDLGQDDWEVGA